MKQRPTYTYQGLLTYLAGGRNKNDRPTNKYAVRIVRRGGLPGVQLHRTLIGLFHEDGTITLDVGRWEDSRTTRQNVGEVIGADIFSVASHKKRHFVQPTRLYTGGGLRNGVPYVNGCLIRNGAAIWHPWMKEQGIDDIRDLTEKHIDVDKEKAKLYYAARRELVKRLRPMLNFIDAKVIAEGPSAPWNWRDWLEDALFSPPSNEDLMGVACLLVAQGAPSGYSTWRAGPTYGPKENAQYLHRGLASIVGNGSWSMLSHLDMLTTTDVLCREV